MGIAAGQETEKQIKWHLMIFPIFNKYFKGQNGVNGGRSKHAVFLSYACLTFRSNGLSTNLTKQYLSTVTKYNDSNIFHPCLLLHTTSVKIYTHRKPSFVPRFQIKEPLHNKVQFHHRAKKKQSQSQCISFNMIPKHDAHVRKKQENRKLRQVSLKEPRTCLAKNIRLRDREFAKAESP